MDDEQEVLSAPGHLPESERKLICSALFNEGSVLFLKLEDLDSADVPYRLLFELKDYRPISYPIAKNAFKRQPSVMVEDEICWRRKWLE